MFKAASLKTNKMHESITGYLFISPWLLGIIVFLVGPIFASLYLSFTDYSLLTKPLWVGASNYKEILTDEIFWKSLKNTVVFTVVNIPIGLALGVALALALNMKIKGVTLLRTVYFTPVVTSIVAVSLVWMWLYNKDFGLLNSFLSHFGVEPINWLGEKTAMTSIIIMSIWQGLGNTMVVYLAGLQGVPEVLYDAAKIDGANGFQRFFHVTLPMLSTTTFFLIIMGIIGGLQVFGQAYVMTQGGPNYATSTIVLMIYQNAFQWYKMGYASSMAWLLFAVIFTVSIIQVKASKRWVHNDSGQ